MEIGLRPQAIPSTHARMPYRLPFETVSQRPLFTHNALLQTLLIGQADQQQRQTVVPACERRRSVLAQVRRETGKE